MKSTLGDGTPVATMPSRRKDIRPQSGKDVPGSGTYDPDYKIIRDQLQALAWESQPEMGKLRCILTHQGLDPTLTMIH